MESELKHLQMEKRGLLNEFKEKMACLEKYNKQLKQDNQTLQQKLNEFETIKSLELSELSKKFESNEFLLNTEIKELKEKNKSREERIQELEEDISQLDAEKSELRAELIEFEKQIENIEEEFRSQLENELNEHQSKALNFEIKYNQILEEFEKFEKEHKVKCQEMLENEINLNSQMLNLKLDLENSKEEKARLQDLLNDVKENETKLKENNLIEIKNLKIDLENSKEEKTKLESLLNELKEQSLQFENGVKQKLEIEIKNLKIDLENKDTELREFKEKFGKFDELNSEYLKISEKFKEKELINATLNDQNAQLHSILNENEIKMKELIKERELSSKELSELQKKLCDCLLDKDNLVKNLLDLTTRYEQVQTNLGEQLKQLQQQQSSKRKSLTPSGGQMSESFMCKIDQHIDSNIQAKLDALLEEKQKYLTEIESSKVSLSELDKFKKLMKKKRLEIKSMLNKSKN